MALECLRTECECGDPLFEVKRMADIDDLFASPNAGAYEQEELRRGPPLSYIGDKSRTALYHIHLLCQALRELPALAMPARHTSPADPLPELRSELIGRADTAFYYALVSFLALYNSLGRLGEWPNQEEKIRALRELHSEAFEEWLDSIESEGSVTG